MKTNCYIYYVSKQNTDTYFHLSKFRTYQHLLSVCFTPWWGAIQIMSPQELTRGLEVVAVLFLIPAGGKQQQPLDQLLFIRCWSQWQLLFLPIMINDRLFNEEQRLKAAHTEAYLVGISDYHLLPINLFPLLTSDGRQRGNPKERDQLFKKQYSLPQKLSYLQTQKTLMMPRKMPMRYSPAPYFFFLCIKRFFYPLLGKHLTSPSSPLAFSAVPPSRWR